MKANVTASSQSQSVAVIRRNSHSRYHYKKVLDGRKQPIRGLWKRNGKSIARIVMEDDAGKKKNGGCRWRVPRPSRRRRHDKPHLQTSPLACWVTGAVMAIF
jgi:hypothetical protein